MAVQLLKERVRSPRRIRPTIPRCRFNSAPRRNSCAGRSRPPEDPPPVRHAPCGSGKERQGPQRTRRAPNCWREPCRRDAAGAVARRSRTLPGRERLGDIKWHSRRRRTAAAVAFGDRRRGGGNRGAALVRRSGQCRLRLDRQPDCPPRVAATLLSAPPLARPRPPWPVPGWRAACPLARDTRMRCRCRRSVAAQAGRGQARSGACNLRKRPLQPIAHWSMAARPRPPRSTARGHLSFHVRQRSS